MIANIWEILGGLALFLLGMDILQESLGKLSGRKFKLFLRRQTTKKPSAVLAGTLSTALLQSSSLVNLIVLALVGAGTIPMANALAVVLGANLGTTLSSWVFASVGFSFNIENAAMGMIAVAGILQLFLDEENGSRHFLRFVLSLGLIFLGLDFIKTGMETAMQHVDLGALRSYPAVVFLVAGTIISVLIQSSSATVLIVLSGLHTGAIDLYSATAMVLGAEVGTTIKLLVASAGKGIAMRQVAWGNFIFNVATTAVVILVLGPVNRFTHYLAGEMGPLIELAFFQTLVNVVSLVLFFPLLSFIGRWLAKKINGRTHLSTFIIAVPASETEAAISALQNEAHLFFKIVMRFSLDVFAGDSKDGTGIEIPLHLLKENITGRYLQLKHLHGDLYGYCMEMQNSAAKEAQTLKIDMLTSAVRNAMYAAKSMKDAQTDILALRNSANEIKYRFYLNSRAEAGQLIHRMAGLLAQKPAAALQELTAIYELVQGGYVKTLAQLYEAGHPIDLQEIEVSMIINYNREVHSALNSLVFGMKDLLLDKEEASHFDSLKGFIR